MQRIRHHEMTDHGLRRCQQRGVPPGVLRTLLDHHDVDRNVGSGCRMLRISRRKARTEGAILGPQIAGRLEDLVVIWSDDSGRVVTVYREAGRRRRYGARA